jgi:predicted transcriptional regulator
MKEEFIKFFEELMAKANITEDDIPENVKAYINAIKDGTKGEKPILTDNGKLVLDYLQKNPDPQKARDIADGMCISSRTVSGTLRKLVNDGFCEKMGQDPVIYAITEKGKDFIIE